MKILVVDDDRVLADIVAYTFQREGFDVSLAYDGLSALQSWRNESPDLIILDINMPDMDGFQVCETIRQEARTPIIMLTVRGEDDDIVHGLELGADDYISKPFSPRQLVARSHAVLRRAGQPTTPTSRHVGPLYLDLNLREVRIGESEPVPLSDQESRLLDLFMSNVGQVIASEGIVEHIWGSRGCEPDDLRQLIRRLRNKVEPSPSKPVYIKNIPGLGYGLMLDHG